MAEHEVMWIGRRPASMAPAENPAATEAFATTITEACTACGCDVEDYVAAAGAYGSWLVRFTRCGTRQRLVWNGKDATLVLERNDAGPQWDEITAVPVASRDPAGFIAAIRTMFGDPA